jgi:hypothetical protein
MPYMCFSYPSDVPAPSGPRRMTVSHCFSYQADLRRMPAGACFSYPADVPSGPREHDAAPSVLPGLRSMPSGTCFRY